MKMKELLTDVETELASEEQENAKLLLCEKVREIKAAKKTLKLLEKKYTEFLETDIEDLELDDYEY